MRAIDTDLIRSRVKLQDVDPTFTNGYHDCPACRGVRKLGVWDNSSFHCFRPSCELNSPSQGSDVIGLFMWKHQCSFKEALTQLAERFGIKPPEHPRELETIFGVYQDLFWGEAGRSGREYMFKRGFSKHFLEEQAVGFAPADCCLEEFGIKREAIERLEFANGGRDYFRNRIIFPVRSVDGALVHLSSRYVGEPPPHTPKVKHTKFKPSITNFLFNEFFVDEYKFGGNLFVAEGVPDALSLLQCGFPSVANFGLQGLGKHLPKFQLFSRVTFCFDSDVFEAGHAKEGEEKSWSIILPQLMDLQMRLPKTQVCIWKPPAPFKDLNEMLLTGIHIQPLDLIEYMVETVGRKVSEHLPILRMILTTGRGKELLAKYVDIEKIEYALEVLR